jgi:hypothetical protein
MKKTTQRIIIIAVILILLIVFFSFKISGFVSANNSIDSGGKSAYGYTHSWTKAICNETHCQDYEIFCDGDKLVRQSPISGAVIQIPKNWADPRNQTMQERVCDVD